MSQRDWFAGSFVMPVALGLAIVVALAAVFGFLILRRRGVYFSLLTLALSAMLYSVAFRWTDVTGGENGLGGITRPMLVGVSFESAASYYALVAAWRSSPCWRCGASTARRWAACWWRSARTSSARASSAIPPIAYKLVAFVASAGLTGLAGMLLVFNNRMTSAEPISVAFSGELLAMVDDRRHAFVPGPGARRAVLRDLSRLLSRVTENWLLYFGLLFVAFVVFSPTGLVGLYERVDARVGAKPVVGEAAMAQRLAGEVDAAGLPAARRHADGDVILEVEGLAKQFGGIHAVQDMSLRLRDRTLHALIGPNGAGKTTAFNLISGMFAPDRGTHHARRPADRRAFARADHARRHRPLVPDHQSVRRR